MIYNLQIEMYTCTICTLIPLVSMSGMKVCSDYSFEANLLKVHLNKATDLPAMDIGGTSGMSSIFKQLL